MKKENISVYVYYIILICLSLGTLYWFNNLDSGRIKFLLDFYKNTVEIFFSNYHYYDSEYNHYVGNGYVIGENCLGLNIIVLIFGVCSFVNVGRLNGYKRILWIAASAIAAVVVGGLANVLRLLSSIYFTAFAGFELIHALLGIVIYLSALFFCYAFSIRLYPHSLEIETK